MIYSCWEKASGHQPRAQCYILADACTLLTSATELAEQFRDSSASCASAHTSAGAGTCRKCLEKEHCIEALLLQHSQQILTIQKHVCFQVPQDSNRQCRLRVLVIQWATRNKHIGHTSVHSVLHMSRYSQSYNQHVNKNGIFKISTDSMDTENIWGGRYRKQTCHHERGFRDTVDCGKEPLVTES